MTYLHAELLKLWSLPSLRLTVALTLAATGLLRWAAGEPGALPLTYTQAGFLVLGVLAVSSEHEAGAQFHTTLLAMPRRLPLLAAKSLTLAATTLPVAATASLTCGADATAYLTLTTLLSAAVTTVIRYPVAALLPLLAVYFIVGPLFREELGSWLPDTMLTHASRGTLATTVWTIGVWVLVAVTFTRSDA
ncbi:MULTISPECIES: hypothetical protein [Catenuloplanes]|uniref:Uncharacterized protein n=1 Tax=Catenuloplanes niger TaxID=587534 RepID=A0AAE4CZU7_9ACTN|nr:hypothetical protein [Catenuloplanes niger]MDR7327269.1 hypothetical protein [Catenuloplanes niger]